MKKLLFASFLFTHIASAQVPCVPTPDPVPEPLPTVSFPALLDLKPFSIDGKPELTLATAIANNAIVELLEIDGRAVPSFEKDQLGRQVAVRKATGYESRQTISGDIQEGVVFKDGRKRMQIIRNLRTGDFYGILIAASFDRFAPIASIIRPTTPGFAKQVYIIDIGNNKTNDIRAEREILLKDFSTTRNGAFLQFNGGLEGQSESAALKKKFGGFQ